jgi:Fe-S oxidoreductase
LAPYAAAGTPIVVLEPSCWSMLVDDVPALVDDPRSTAVAEACLSLEGLVLDRDLQGLRDFDERVLVHSHCHSRAIEGGSRTREAVRLIPGIEVADSGAGCCGMAGGFGYRYPEISRRIAHDRLIPAIQRAGAQIAVAAGTSCRQQIAEFAGTRVLHPAELLAAALPDGPP